MTNQTNKNSKKSSVIGKRILAFLLALAMIMQPTLSSVGTIVYAEETTEAGAAGSEPQGGTEVQQPAAEPTQPAVEPAQPAVEPSEPAAADDGSGQAASDADAQNQSASDQQAADPDEKKDETKEDEEEKFPAQSFKGSVSGLVVNVSAPEGALPEETQMKVSEVNKQQVINTIEKQTDLEVEKIRAADIAFFNKEGKEIEPKQAVSVSMSPSGLDASASKAVVHIDDSGKVEKVSASIAKSGAANFQADAFSVYVVVETVVPRLTVKFVNGSTTIATMYVKAADTAAEVEKILYDPGAGTVPAGQVFKGWTTNQNYTTPTEDEGFMSIADVRTDAMQKAAALTEDGEVTYYAAVFKQYKITYVDGGGITVGSSVAETPSRETEAPYTVNMGYSTDDTHNFEGWIVTDGQSNVKDYPDGAKTETIDGETIYYYENGTEITVTGDVVFSVDAPAGY